MLSLINAIIVLILATGIGSIIALYLKLKKALPALGILLLTIGNALADDKITEGEWKEIISNAHDFWEIITGGASKLAQKNLSKLCPPLVAKNKWE